ncbi:MAG: glycosyltransferase family 4 protein [Magnetococcus sp. WYHC-3]
MPDHNMDAPSQAKPLRLALIRQRYTDFGGAERFVAAAAAALGRQGVAVTVITRNWPHGRGGARVELNPFHLTRRGRDVSFARAVQRHLAQVPYDLVQSHERIPGVALYRAGDGVHARWLELRSATLPRWRRWLLAWSPYHRHLLTAERRLLTHPALRAVICNSCMVRDEIQRFFGTPPETLRVIHSGVDSVRFHPDNLLPLRDGVRRDWGIPHGVFVHLLLGSGYDRKGVATALAALRECQGWLLVVGRERRMGRWQRLARKLGVAQRVIFAGAVRDVLPCYAAADALVLPTLYDPFPNVVLEAMACALPVMVSRTSGAVDLLRDGDNGVVVDPLDALALGRHMAQWERDPAQAAQMGLRGRATVLPLTPEAMAGALQALYAGLLGKSMTS